MFSFFHDLDFEWKLIKVRLHGTHLFLIDIYPPINFVKNHQSHVRMTGWTVQLSLFSPEIETGYIHILHWIHSFLSTFIMITKNYQLEGTTSNILKLIKLLKFHQLKTIPVTKNICMSPINIQDQEYKIRNICFEFLMVPFFLFFFYNRIDQKHCKFLDYWCGVKLSKKC